ncbi:PH domain-containing protein [Nesterenkonia xinjiangensis]|uniref:Putative membrane protein n=1 Tax=Nesterenkonia xinjiangensis TaxID=225327 RepID=A0A7Z0GJU8_9MICC|nr:PH domain-containing protein [Nesterenkonia xinjiangensis]NYJ77327.1 putative membrane protein [Nesterenkonia xinjiangensis]
MSLSPPHPAEVQASRDAPATTWHRLSVRIIWVDLVISIVSIVPPMVAIWGFGIDVSAGQIWPLIALAAFGVLGAVADGLRWVFTRFRVTPTYVELKTGVFLRRHRSIQRDRIRSVDVEAKLRHRLARMRVVNIGAGQQASAGESALSLDALSAEDARRLQHSLLSAVEGPAEVLEASVDSELSSQHRRTTAQDGAGHESPAAAPEADEPLRIFARFEPSWCIYNMFTIWAYVLALGLGWGALWLLSTVGVDLYGFVVGLLDWDSIGWVGTTLIAVVVVGALGAVGLGINYFAENWNFELARIRSRDGTMLRTRRGLFTTREVNRDENRIRGAQISEPVLWRWMGVSDTSVLTTGLDVWSMSEPAAILPRGPISRTREVAGQVLGDPENPFHAHLRPHPWRALRRRLWWAGGLTVGLGALLTWLAVSDVLPYEVIWATAAFGPASLLAAVLAYRALGHTITDRYVITRSGLLSRATTVLQRSSVSTIVIRESLLQRRLNLRTVSTMTAAGQGGYDTPDIERRQSLEFAVQAAPGLLDPFLVPDR